MLPRAAPLLALLMLLGGCLAGPEDDPAASPVGQARAVPTSLAACDILEAVVNVAAARAEPHAPPGFALRANDDGTVGVVLGAATCAEGSRAFLALPVEPEDERLHAENVRHFFEPEHLVVDGEAFARTLAEARGAATNVTRIHASAAPPQPTFVVEGAEGWAHRAATVGAAAAPAPEALVGGVFREWFPARGGYGYLEATFGSAGATFALLPQAQVETGEGTLSREVLGAEATGDLFVLAGSAYADATLGFVPYP